jgi:hypothetical protein
MHAPVALGPQHRSWMKLAAKPDRNHAERDKADPRRSLGRDRQPAGRFA